jgi:hypothetical protein
MLDDLLTYVRADGRVCPQPARWQELWEMLPDRRRLNAGGWEPPLPVILGAWWDTPALLKLLRLEEHVRYAAHHGALSQVDAFLRSLGEKEWAHFGEC